MAARAPAASRGGCYCMTPDPIPRGWTVPRLAKLLCVSPETVRTWIRNKELKAINTARRNGRPRYVILPHHLEEFERRHLAATETSTAPPRRRRRQPDGWTDF